MQIQLRSTIGRHCGLALALSFVAFGTISLSTSVEAQDCLDVCGTKCVKPWAVPDRWDDVTGIKGYTEGASNWRNNGRWDHETFTDTNSNGLHDSGEPYVDANGNGNYDAEEYDPTLTGYIAGPYSNHRLAPNGDAGLELVLHPEQGGGNSLITPGQYQSIRLPPINKGDPVAGADAYRQNIATCNPSLVEPGDWLELETGANTGTSNQGMRDLIAQDPDAYWDPTTQSVQGSRFAVSPRLVFIPLYDPRIPVLPGHVGAVQIVKVAAFFMEGMTGPSEVRGRLMRARGEGALCGAGSPPGVSFISYCPPLEVDVRPGSCSNPINLQSKGVLPVAVLGRADFDVTKIDPASVTLAGVSALRFTVEDVAVSSIEPNGERKETDCKSYGPDGFPDLVLKFDHQAIAAGLGPAASGETRLVTLLCNLKAEFGGEVFEGQDVVTVVGGGKVKQSATDGTVDDPTDDHGRSDDDPGHRALNLTNPYRPQAAMAYSLPKAGMARLAIYDPRGQLVATLVEGRHEAGTFETAWNGKNRRGRGVSPGVYFVRLQVDGGVTTGKLVLAR